MIHPLTLVTFVAFFGAGFYVFQTKEEVAKLDRELRDIRRATETERGRTQVLAAEWARLNDQDRLRQMARSHLGHMQPMEPAQFQRLEDAQRRMPVALAFTPMPTGFQPRSDAPTAPGEVLVFNAATFARDSAPAPLPVVLATAPVAPAAAPAPTPVAMPVAMPPAPVVMAALPVAEPPRPRAESLAGDAAPRPTVPVPPPGIRTAMANPTLVSAPAAGSMLGGGASALPPPVPFSR